MSAVEEVPAAVPGGEAVAADLQVSCLAQLLQLGRDAHEVRTASQGPVASTAQSAQLQRRAALMLRHAAAALLPAALQGDEEAGAAREQWGLGPPSTREQLLYAGVDAVDECLSVLLGTIGGGACSSAGPVSAADAAGQRGGILPAKAAADCLAALSMLLQGLAASSQHHWDTTAASLFPVAARFAEELQQRLLLLMPLAAAAAYAAPTACNGMLEAAAASVSFCLVTLVPVMHWSLWSGCVAGGPCLEIITSSVCRCAASCPSRC
jgi:hypothetical protein